MEAIEVPECIIASKYVDTIGEVSKFGVVAENHDFQLTCLVQDNNRHNQN